MGQSVYLISHLPRTLEAMVSQMIKNLPAVQETQVWSLGQDDLLKKGFPDGSEVKVSACNAGDLGSIPGLGRSPGEGNGKPLQYSCLENPMDGGAWWATVHGVSKSRTWLNDFTFTHSSILAWRIPWIEERGGLQSLGHKELETTERLAQHFLEDVISLDPSQKAEKQ